MPSSNGKRLPVARKGTRSPATSPRGWWVEEPLRIVEICNAFDLNRLSLQDEVDAVAGLEANAQHFHCMEMSGGMDDRRLFFKTSAAGRKNEDRLGRYLPLAHRRKIRVIVYFNVHWYTRDFGRKHPDWAQLRQDGSPIDDVYSTGTSFCVNSPYREWVFQILRDLCRYEIDGVFFDGPIFFAGTCCCCACQKLFKDKTGAPLPPKSQRDHPSWKDLIAFQADVLARFLADSNAIIKALRPEALFYMNGNSNHPYWPTGRDNRRIIATTDMLGAEGGFVYNDLNQTPIYKPGVSAKLLSAQSETKPAVVFDCAGHKAWSWYLLPKTEISLLLAETIAHGANYWLAVFPEDLSQPELKVVASYGNLIRRHPDPFWRSQSLARIALLWPSHSVEFYKGSSVPLTDFTREIRAEGVGDINQEFDGFYEGLARAQAPFDVIDEVGLEELSRYQLVVLPNAPCLSARHSEILRRFVADGGSVVASFETSLCDEWGKHLNNFRLAELFGIRFRGSAFGPMRWDYVTPAAKPGPLLDGIARKFFPAPTYGIEVEPTSGQALLHFCERLKGSYEHVPTISRRPMLVVNSYGKGKAIYLAGTFGATLANLRFPEYLALLSNLANQFSTPQVTLKDAPWVEVSLRRKGDKVYLHLINQTSGLKRPLTSLHPLDGLKIKLLGIGVRKARALRLGRNLATKHAGGALSLTLPRLEDYEVIELA